ncbi:hypothetical protein [Promicromonospora sp. NPDC050249]|uniref:hypothetical protein n=1 Tax=Promicromonospora sp. NPDC050249 TaxID=3154743 RepID=UPI0033DD8945
MGFLSTLLPGVRDFRTPFVVGALWLTAATLWAWARYDGDLSQANLLSILYDLLGHTPDVVILGVLGFTTYLIGLVARGVQDWISNLYRRAQFGSRLSKLMSSVLVKLGLVPRLETKDYLADAARERFAKYPPAVRDVARQILLEEYELADVILTSRSPEQYQEYDRWRSEAEFRNGIWFPLFLIGLNLGPLAGGLAAWLIPVTVGVVSAMLKFQGIEKRAQAEQRLASAVYFNLASTPLFDTLLSELNRRTEQSDSGVPTKRLDRSEQIAFVFDFLHTRGLVHLMKALLAYSPERKEMKGVFDHFRGGRYSYIARTKDLQELLLVAYGGVEWDKEAGQIANKTVRVEHVLAAHDRLRSYLASAYDNGDLQVEELAEGGALSCVENGDALALQGDATDEEWNVAVHMEDSLNAKWASIPELAFSQD